MVRILCWKCALAPLVFATWDRKVPGARTTGFFLSRWLVSCIVSAVVVYIYILHTSCCIGIHYRVEYPMKFLEDWIQINWWFSVIHEPSSKNLQSLISMNLQWRLFNDDFGVVTRYSTKVQYRKAQCVNTPHCREIFPWNRLRTDWLAAAGRVACYEKQH